MSKTLTVGTRLTVYDGDGISTEEVAQRLRAAINTELTLMGRSASIMTTVVGVDDDGAKVKRTKMDYVTGLGSASSEHTDPDAEEPEENDEPGFGG